MKTKTLEAIHNYMKSGDIYFPDYGYNCIFRLTDRQIRAIIRMEYSISPKNVRILRKRLKILVNDLLIYILKEENETGGQNEVD